jgi:hypothetical protein
MSEPTATVIRLWEPMFTCRICDAIVAQIVVTP